MYPETEYVRVFLFVSIEGPVGSGLDPCGNPYGKQQRSGERLAAAGVGICIIAGRWNAPSGAALRQDGRMEASARHAMLDDPLKGVRERSVYLSLFGLELAWQKVCVQQWTNRGEPNPEHASGDERLRMMVYGREPDAPS